MFRFKIFFIKAHISLTHVEIYLILVLLLGIGTKAYKLLHRPCSVTMDLEIVLLFFSSTLDIILYYSKFNITIIKDVKSIVYLG